MQRWAVHRVMDEGCFYAIQYGRAVLDIGGWLQRHPMENRPSEQLLRRLVRRHTLGTVLATPSKHLVIIRRQGRRLHARMATPGELATLLQLPALHPLRTGLAAVHPSQARRLVGQAVNVSSAAALLSYGMELARVRGYVLLGVAGAGVSFIAAAMDVVLPGSWGYAFFVENHPAAIRAHTAAWQAHSPLHFRTVCDREAAARMPHVEVWQYSARCEPFSSDTLLFDPKKVERALDEVEASLEYPRLHRPRLILLEETEGILRPMMQHALQRYEAAILQLNGYRWVRVKECPSKHAGALAARPRVWYVGYRR